MFAAGVGQNRGGNCPSFFESIAKLSPNTKAQRCIQKSALEEAPFELIFINGAVEANIEALFAQLKVGGRLVAIKRLPGDPALRAGKAVRYEKIDGGKGCRVLFDASAPVLKAFRQDEQFTFF